MAQALDAIAGLLNSAVPIDNTSVNPARSFATAIFAKGWAFEQLWVFIVFPAIGAVIAAFTWNALTPAEEAAPTRRKRS